MEEDARVTENGLPAMECREASERTTSTTSSEQIITDSFVLEGSFLSHIDSSAHLFSDALRLLNQELDVSCPGLASSQTISDTIVGLNSLCNFRLTGLCLYPYFKEAITRWRAATHGSEPVREARAYRISALERAMDITSDLICDERERLFPNGRSTLPSVLHTNEETVYFSQMLLESVLQWHLRDKLNELTRPQLANWRSFILHLEAIDFNVSPNLRAAWRDVQLTVVGLTMDGLCWMTEMNRREEEQASETESEIPLSRLVAQDSARILRFEVVHRLLSHGIHPVLQLALDMFDELPDRNIVLELRSDAVSRTLPNVTLPNLTQLWISDSSTVKELLDVRDSTGSISTAICVLTAVFSKLGEYHVQRLQFASAFERFREVLLNGSAVLRDNISESGLSLQDAKCGEGEADWSPSSTSSTMSEVRESHSDLPALVFLRKDLTECGSPSNSYQQWTSDTTCRILGHGTNKPSAFPDVSVEHGSNDLLGCEQESQGASITRSQVVTFKPKQANEEDTDGLLCGACCLPWLCHRG